MMQWKSQVSTHSNLDSALTEAAEGLSASTPANPPDLLVAFSSDFPPEETLHLPKLLSEKIPHRFLLGCTAGGVIGGGEEIERRPALSLAAAWMPDVDLCAFHLPADGVPPPDADAEAWEKALRTVRADSPHFLLLADPFSFDAADFLQGLDRHFPEGKKIGGLASGAVQRGQNRLFLNRETYDSGLIGISLRGNIEIDTLVAQGCRPIGQPMFVTRCRQNLLQELDGKLPSEVLQSLYHSLVPRDQDLFRQSLFLGLVMKEAQHEYRQGDFLIRNIIGIDESRESLVVGSLLQEGQVVQFHLRDAQTSTEDLNAMLIRYKTEHLGQSSPAGSLLFSCLGRGAHLYGEPNHDSRVFHRFIGELPLAGFFCNGEIGPVHGQTYLHGYTSSFGIFREKDR